MASAQNSPAGSGDPKKWTAVVVPAVGVAFIVLLVVIVAVTSDSPTEPSGKEKGKSGGLRDRRSNPDVTKLSDGTLPQANDPNLKEMGGGLRYRDLKEGDGEEVARGATAIVDYIGWRHADGFRFDTSFKPGGKPFPANLRSGVIKGWIEGVPGMKVGGIRKLVIPPEMGYGASGAGDDIPPGATLVFEIEVLGVK
jgi:hypothetical protein